MVFFSNYAHVLVCLTQTPQPTTREIALRVGITERAAQRIVTRLVEAGVAKIRKQGHGMIGSLGSTAFGVLNGATCDVLTVRDREKRA